MSISWEEKIPAFSAQRVSLVGLVLCAFALRLYRLDAQSLWYDEGVTAQLAQRSLADLTRWTANDIQPPLYYYVSAGWGRLAGWSEWSLRFPSAGFGLLLVPLLAVLTQRLTKLPRAALLAALLTTVHPALLYYSQEARMYTLLLLGGALAGYCLVRNAEPGPNQRWLVRYILVASSACYTHYFAFFLLLALGMAYLLARQRPLFATLGSFLLANLAILLLYAPWLRVLFNRLAVDNSYWQGDFKLSEGLRHAAITFTSGESMREATAVWLLAPLGLITLFALGRLLRAQPAAPTADHMVLVRYTLLWLVLPWAGVLLLATFTPKFNARYTLIALPGLLVLWAAGLSSPTDVSGAASKPRYAPLLPITSVLILLAVFLWADYNWFFDRAFTKDQWRQVTEFLRPRLKPEEAVVLVSGHAWPVWHYYAPDLPVTRLPEIDVLDVTTILDYTNTAMPLRRTVAASTGKTGIWLVEWQHHVVDPNGIVPIQLELGGREKGQSATFWGLTLRRFSQIKPERIVDQPPISVPLAVNFGEQLQLLGYHLMENGDLLLFWQRQVAPAALAPDYQLTGQTLSATGELVATLPDRRPANYAYPVARWPVGKVVTGQIPATSWLGAQPMTGTYTLQLSVYALVDGAPQLLFHQAGEAAVALPITVAEFD